MTGEIGLRATGALKRAMEPICVHIAILTIINLTTAMPQDIPSVRIGQDFIKRARMIFDIAAAPAKEGCAFILASAKGDPALACGARRQKGSSYCTPHHAICHITGGSIAEARRLREIGALALVVGGRRGEAARQPPERFLRRLERQARVFSWPQRSLYIHAVIDE